MVLSKWVVHKTCHGKKYFAIKTSHAPDTIVHCRLISAVFRLCEVEKNAASAKLVDALSPQVTSSTMWFLQRWLRSYLLPDENYYVQVHHYFFIIQLLGSKANTRLAEQLSCIQRKICSL